MTDIKATPEQWAQQEEYAKQVQDCDTTCLLELRARVEALEASFQPTSNDREIRSSLLERVQSAIYDVDYPNGTDEARAAIREVNAWLRERAGGTRASWLLDNEVEQ
jgi:hypothetical protein